MNIGYLFKKSFLLLSIRMAGIGISFLMFAALAPILGDRLRAFFAEGGQQLETEMLSAPYLRVIKGKVASQDQEDG